MPKHKRASKTKRQRAVITITDHEDPDKFNATIQFEPSLKTLSMAERKNNPVVMAAWAAWMQVKSDRASRIILTEW